MTYQQIDKERLISLGNKRGTYFYLQCVFLLVFTFAFAPKNGFAEGDKPFYPSTKSVPTRWNDHATVTFNITREARSSPQFYGLLSASEYLDHNGAFKNVASDISFSGSGLFQAALGNGGFLPNNAPFIAITGHGDGIKINGLGNVVEVAGFLSSAERDLAKISGAHPANIRRIVDTCHGAKFTSSLMREVNGWNPEMNMTVGVPGPDGPVTKLFYSAGHQGLTYSTTQYRFTNPVPDSYLELPLEEDRFTFYRLKKSIPTSEATSVISPTSNVLGMVPNVGAIAVLSGLERGYNGTLTTEGIVSDVGSTLAVGGVLQAVAPKLVPYVGQVALAIDAMKWMARAGNTAEYQLRGSTPVISVVPSTMGFPMPKFGQKPYE